MNTNWKQVAVMLTHFMYVVDLGLTPEDHSADSCYVCKEARQAYLEALASEQ